MPIRRVTCLGPGLPPDQRLTPIAEMKELIEERTEAKSGSMGGFFKLNPRVDDLPDQYSLEKDGIRLMVMGTVQKGGRRMRLSGERDAQEPGCPPSLGPE